MSTSRPEVDELLRAVLARGEAALARTTELLDVLREAGVVDAGGAGLVEIVRGIVAAVTGEELALPDAAPELGLEAIHRELSEFRYCTAFLVEGSAARRGLARTRAGGPWRLAARRGRRVGAQDPRAHG